MGLTDSQNFFFILRDYKFFKIANFYFARYYYRFFGWKFSNWFIDQELVFENSIRIGVLGWYRYWIAYKRLQFFLNHFSKEYFLSTSLTLISTSPKYYSLIKFYAEKLNQGYVIGYNKEFFTRFYVWQNIYHSEGFDYKFHLTTLPHLAVLLQGSFLGDFNYIKGLKRYNLTYLIVFSIFELFKNSADGFTISVPPGLMMHYAMAFAYNSLAKQHRFSWYAFPASLGGEARPIKKKN